MCRISFLSACKVWCLGGLWISCAAMATAQTVPPDAILMPDPRVENAEAARLGRQLYISPKNLVDGEEATAGQVSIPRLAASLVSVAWLGHAPDDSLSLKIEQTQWIVQWRKRPAAASVIVLTFDGNPKLMSEVKPILASGDGGIYLPASQATTSGDKIRYEPQTFKNTVGYWVGKQDFAQWKFEAVRPGKYNVGILQGCGVGQGGSRARLSVTGSVAANAADQEKTAELEFEVLETGHFQNFQWRHLGSIEIDPAGTQTLKLEPVEIKKNALMDVRAIHLVPVPQ
jgi:hypothetical protein